jgi:hypothetical protein
VGKQGRINQRASLGDVRGSWASSVRQRERARGRPGAATDRDRARDRRGGQGRLSQTMALEMRRPAAGRGVPAQPRAR